MSQAIPESLHGLSWAEFDQLARSEGGPGPVRSLRAAESSRRQHLLLAIVEQTVDDPARHGPLGSPETAWKLLVQAQETDPRAFDAVLTHPYTGSWAGHTTRLLEHGVPPGRQPLWVHIGHLHALAAAAALRAGIEEFRVRVPVWRGNIALPTLGIAHLDGVPDGATAQIIRADGRTVVQAGPRTVVVPADPAADATGWRGVRTAELVAGGRRLAVRIDDVDPYRGLFGPRPPEPLDEGDWSHWQDMLARAWELLVRLVPEYADALPAGLDTIVPDPPYPFRLPSASSGEAFGSAIIARPEDPATLAAALVHEFQHIRLGGLLQLTALHTNDRTERLYAPWRDDPRPLGGVIHGIYAFFAVTEFYRALSRDQPEDVLAAFEFAHWRHQVGNTLDRIRGDAALTEAGRRFLARIADRLAPWQHDEVPEIAARWASLLAADHHAGWRIRHHRPDADAVDRIVGAWSCGAPAPGADSATTILDTQPDGEWTEARADLLRVRLGADGETRARQAWRAVPGASEADFALVDGRAEDALDGYRAELVKDPDGPNALIGLGLALQVTGDVATAELLLSRPELVRAVHRGLLESRTGAPPTPEEVARWLAGAGC
ncbi:HEXXH motif domain-containing protein [Amycolatopsis sp. DG1A-15b]|uniref:HEXXH motif domain-containing protein n=1 Tax=Amycolatopsis sp. DG1A-15b TaxID=3052846 RepID=UPI00255BDEA8|nr:HEXXH motif domain-containing protein [Amycolatopsis sp. DG1A-15b]WIX85277.1 HEXXH motif domain-containing protein [Amycolatopsis sp. DG1A-15b]